MSEPTEREVVDALKAAPPITLAAGPHELPPQTPPDPDATWELPGGMAWVYCSPQNRKMITRPVILADGFNTGPSTLAFSWAGLELSGFPLISELRNRGRDVILLGFQERSASILDNAQAAMAAILRTTAEQVGNSRLAVGGFSMGGLVTRYALAKMETQRMDHRTGLYFSYDSPHNGAYIPVSLQAFAHYIRKLDARFSDQINSPASQQLMWRHMSDWQGKPEISPLRTEFLDAMERVGGWPQIPRLIGVANGVGTGVGNGIKPGQTAVKGKGLGIVGTDLRTMPAAPDSLAATLRVITPQKPEVQAPALPDIDGAPGGMLDSFKILADALNKVIGLGVENPIKDHCFVPSVSGVAMRGLDTHEDLYANIDGMSPDESLLDDFLCASQNEPHTKITEELCTWLMDRLPD